MITGIFNRIRHFVAGDPKDTPLSASRMNEIVDALNALIAMEGSGGIVIRKSKGRFLIELSRDGIEEAAAIYNSGGGSGSAVPPGGTTGQVLVKASNTDGDVEWVDVETLLPTVEMKVCIEDPPGTFTEQDATLYGTLTPPP